MKNRKVREIALKRLKETTQEPIDKLQDSDKLVEDLRKHQIELENQNEELQQTNSQLEAVRDRFISLFDNAPVGYLILDQRGRILRVNESLCQLLNYERYEMVNIPLFGFIYIKDQPEYQNTYASFFNDPDGKRLQLRLLRKNDDVMHSELIGNKDTYLNEISGEQSQDILLVSVIDITAEYEIRERRKISERKFEILFNQSAIGIAVTDVEGTFLKVNSRFAEILGYSPDELKGINFREITDTDDLSLDEKYFSEVMTGSRDEFSLEKRFLHKDGQPVWVKLFSSVVRDRFGEIQYAIASTINISQEKAYQLQQKAMIQKLGETEKLLKESNNRYRLLSEVTFEGIIIHFNAIGIDANQSFLRITGYDVNEIIGKNLFEIIDTKDHETVKANLQSNYAQPYLITLIRKDGSRFLAEIEARDAEHNGSPIRITAVRDVTEHLEAQEKLKYSEKLLKFAIVQMPIPVIISDVQGSLKTLYNQPAIDLVRYEPNSIGETLLPGQQRILPMLNTDHSQIEFAELPLHKAISLGISTKNQEMIIPHPEGDRWISASAEPLKDEQGNIIAGIVVFPDITEQKETEAELEQHRLHLEKLVKERTAELEKQKEELERLNKLFVGREFRIKNLREEVKSLKKKLNANGITCDNDNEIY